MAFLPASLIWAAYAIVILVLITVASIFVYLYQKPEDRVPSVTITCIASITTLLATVLLLPVDIALISSTNLPALGQRKEWATQTEVDKIVVSLSTAYYLLYTLDALLCLVVIPFTYFWYEEYDEVAAEAGEQTLCRRFWATFKYTLSFIVITILLFTVGFLVPAPRGENDGSGFDFFKKLLSENRGERALTFTLGLLITIGMALYVLYTSTGIALLPIRLIKGPRYTSGENYETRTTEVQLEINQERQRQLETRCGGNPEILSSKDRRELDSLVRDERTLIRRQRLADELAADNQGWPTKLRLKIETAFRPFKILIGIILFMATLVTCVSMLLTMIDKARNSLCKHRCGYILGNINIFNPVNWALIQSAKAIAADYVIFTAIVLVFFCGTIVGITTIGVRLFFLRIFQVRPGHTSPQALLLTTVMLMLSVFALNYSIPMVIAPQYATFGRQTFCDRVSDGSLGEQLDCSNTRHLVKPCSEMTSNLAARRICIPSVTSTFLNRVTINFPFFGAIFFASQFAFLGIYLIASIISMVRAPKPNEQQLDDAEEAEEERLLASTGRQTDSRLYGSTTPVGRESGFGRAGG